MKKSSTPLIGLILGMVTLVFCTKDEAFRLGVVPGYMEAIVGQRCVFLVGLSEGGEGGAVDISASVEDAQVIVEYSPLEGEGVAEVTVIPSASSLKDTIWGDTVTLWVKGERGSFKDSSSVMIYVTPGCDDRYEYASQVRDSFVRRLADSYPELGINSQIEWTSTIVRPHILVVSHYLFFSDEWEMWVDWHNTIPPYDWTNMYLRRRGQEVTPSYAFEIASQTEWGDAYPVTPPDSIIR